MWAIAAVTMREALRRRILPVTVLAAVVFLGLYGLAVRFITREMAAHPEPLVQAVIYPQLFSLGLYFGSFIVSFLAIFAAVGTVSGEIENGTMLAIAPRPVRRSSIILGKFAGFGLMLTAYAALLFLALVAIIRGLTGYDLGAPAGPLALFCLQPLVLLAVTLLGTTFLSTMANGVVMLALWAVSTVGGMIEQIGWMMDSASLKATGIITSLIMPVDAIYRKVVCLLLGSSGAQNPLAAAAQMGPFGAQAEPSLWMTVYTLLYLVAAVLAAARVFARRDI